MKIAEVVAGLAQIMDNVARAQQSNELVPMEKHPTPQGVASHAQLISPASERVPINLRLGPHISPILQSTDRVHVQQRLGIQDSVDVCIENNNATQTKRKPGRPPGRKADKSSLNPELASTSRRRTTSKAKLPPSRRPRGAASPNGPARSLTGTSSASRQSRPSSKRTTPTSSENQPLCNLIPASSRRRVDFQNPSPLGP